MTDFDERYVNLDDEEMIVEAKRKERRRINEELRKRPFGWCSICANIPCQCK